MFKLTDKLTFGKHKGEVLKELVDEDWKGYNYIAWCSQNIDWFEVDEEAFKHIQKKGIEYAFDYNLKKSIKVETIGFGLERKLDEGPTAEYAREQVEDGIIELYMPDCGIGTDYDDEEMSCFGHDAFH